MAGGSACFGSEPPRRSGNGWSIAPAFCQALRTLDPPISIKHVLRLVARCLVVFTIPLGVVSHDAPGRAEDTPRSQRSRGFVLPLSNPAAEAGRPVVQLAQTQQTATAGDASATRPDAGSSTAASTRLLPPQSPQTSASQGNNGAPASSAAPLSRPLRATEADPYQPFDGRETLPQPRKTPHKTPRKTPRAISADSGEGAAPRRDSGALGGVLLGPDALTTMSERPLRSRSVADHWTPWWRLRRLPTFSGPWKAVADTWWRNSGRARSITEDLGIGHERVMYAPSIVDTAIDVAGAAVQFHSDRGLNVADRAAYFWAPGPLGPGYDPEVNLLDTRLRLAVGNRRAMAITEFSLRSLDPTDAPNTTGFGDMVIGAKALMLDGRRLKVASVFRTYLSTGPASRGLGTGHTSLEPGLLTRYCLSPSTFLFSEVKYWTPIGADVNYSGDILTCGLAISTIFRESDVYAVLPTFEVRTLSFLFGGQTNGLAPPGGGAPDPQPIVARIDGRTAIEIYPGARFVLGPRGDMGLWELNVAAGFTLGEDAWFDSRLLVGLRWNY